MDIARYNTDLPGKIMTVTGVTNGFLIDWV